MGGQPRHGFAGAGQRRSNPWGLSDPSFQGPISNCVCQWGLGRGLVTCIFPKQVQGSGTTPGRAQPGQSGPCGWLSTAPPPRATGDIFPNDRCSLGQGWEGARKEPYSILQGEGPLTFCSPGWPLVCLLAGARLVLSRSSLPLPYPLQSCLTELQPPLGLCGLSEPSVSPTWSPVSVTCPQTALTVKGVLGAGPGPRQDSSLGHRTLTTPSGGWVTGSDLSTRV